jgi:hypothetical protein
MAWGGKRAGARSGTGSALRLNIYLIGGGSVMPPPPLSDFWGFIEASFPIPGNLRSVFSGYYVNNVYVNTVDVIASHLEHSRCERK